MEKDTAQELPRLQKVLALAGVGSRRACETLIENGRVTVNGKKVTEPGVKIDPQTAVITFDGEPVETAKPPKLVYIMLNKPLGFVSTVSDPRASKTVMELLEQVDERVYPVGRLDADSSGLLLLTNDGEFANRLTHPRFHVPKIYRVRVRGFVDKLAAKKLMEGIDLPDGKTAPAGMKFVEWREDSQSTILDITLFEGRNRQVRRMMEFVGHPVRELHRVAFGELKMKGLLPGTWRKLRPDEVEHLLALAKPTPTPPREGRREKPIYRPRNPIPSAPVEELKPGKKPQPRRQTGNKL